MVRDVAKREGWSEQTARAILRDGIDNGFHETAKHRRKNAEGIEEMKERGEIDRGRRTIVYPGA
jgi:hypothetical protein